MSLNFSDVTNDDGIIQVIEQTCGFQIAGISSNATLLKQFTGKVNRAMDDATALILSCGGTWQYDDSNHTDYPFITTNLVSGQRDYTFTTDEQGNIILDIYKVTIKDAAGTYHEIYPVDQQNEEGMWSFYNGLNTGGMPTRYDKTANGIFLDAIPNYASTNGLKVFINRESSYFTTSDTTKKPGFDGRCHEYVALKASETYARDKRLANYPDLVRDIAKAEQRIDDVYGKRERDKVKQILPLIRSSR